MGLEAVAPSAEVIRIEPRGKIKIKVTPAMLDAGRHAFLRHRATLDDLYQCFDVDRDAFLRAIYRAMDSAKAI